VIRVSEALIPSIEKLKQGLSVTQNQGTLSVEQAQLLERRAEDLQEELRQTQAKCLELADRLSMADGELKEQGKLVMKLIKEKKHLELNLSLQKPAESKKIASVPYNPVPYHPVKVVPAKVHPVVLHGIAGTTAKNAKVTLVLNPESIPRIDSTGKKQTTLKISVESMAFEADLNSKSYRKAIATIDELGADNCNAILQGSMKVQGKLEGVGLVVQPKKGKEETPA
jgi:uncharacterized protein YlxW (UPF0749 family)